MLTVKQIENAKPKDSAYRLADAGGLFLFIPPTGSEGCCEACQNDRREWYASFDHLIRFQILAFSVSLR